MTVREAAALLRQKDNILILTHRRPDGDTMGCAAGLCAALRQLGKRAWVLENPEATELNGYYAAPYLAPADAAPDFVVSVDIAARQLFFPAAAQKLLQAPAVDGGDHCCAAVGRGLHRIHLLRAVKLVADQHLGREVADGPLHPHPFGVAG